MRKLEKLQPGPQGYTSCWLRDSLTIGQVIVYISPIGVNLDMDPDDEVCPTGA